MRTRPPIRTRARSALVAMMAAAMLMGSASAAFADDDSDNTVNVLSCLILAAGCE